MILNVTLHARKRTRKTSKTTVVFGFYVSGSEIVLFSVIRNGAKHRTSWVIGQNVSRQLATSSENLVTITQFLVALVTSESQF